MSELRPDLHSTSNAFRLIIYDILAVWWEIVVNKVKVAEVTAAVEHYAEQLEEVIRPKSEEFTRTRNAEGCIRILSFENLTQPVENAREQASEAMKETAKANRRNGHI